MTQDSALIGLGAQFKVGQTSTLRVGYTGEFGNNHRDHGANILWNKKF